MTASLITAQDGFRVDGVVSFDEIISLRRQGEALIKKSALPNTTIVIDLSTMQDQDAAPLSLLLCWVRFAKQKKSDITFKSPSLSLRSMATLFGIAALIPFNK